MSAIKTFLTGVMHGSKFHVALKYIKKSPEIKKKFGFLLIANLVFYGLSRLVHELHHKALKEGSYTFDADSHHIFK